VVKAVPFKGVKFVLSQDSSLRRALLLYHNVFMTSQELLNKFEAFYRKPASSFPDIKHSIASKLNVVSFLQEWIRLHYVDLLEIEEKVSSLLKVLANEVYELIIADDSIIEISDGGINVLLSEIKTTQCLLEETRDEFDRRTRRRMQEDQNKKQSAPRPDISEFDPEHVAIAMTVSDYRAFVRVQPREFVDKAWSRKETCM